MGDPLLNKRGGQQFKSRGPLGTGVGKKPLRRPCGIDDPHSGCQAVTENLFDVLRRSPEFSAVFDKLKGTGVKITHSNQVSAGPQGGRYRPAGSYDPIKGTIELPTKVYTSRDKIKSPKLLALIAHEVYHAYQFRKLHELASDGTAEERAKIIARSVEKMGRDRFVKNALRLEKAAESFAQKVVLKVLGKEHADLRLYREEIGAITPAEFYRWSIDSWWDANEDTYRRDAEIEYVQWTYRLSEGDYAAEFDKEALKEWLQKNPDVK